MYNRLLTLPLSAEKSCFLSYLTRRGKVEPGSELFGKAFEHFIVNEIIAHASYSELFYPIAYWRTTSGFEVDLILDDGAAAIEIKSTAKVNRHHLKGIRSLKDEHEYNMRRYLVVSLDPNPRKTEDGIEILPWAVFLERLWAGEIIQ